MKFKSLILPAATMYFSILYANAQSKILETITSNAKTSATSKVVESANQTVNKTLDKILDGNIFKKKAGKTPKTDTPSTPKEQSITNSDLAGTTELTISNTDYTSVVALADIIKSNKNVSDVQRSFSNGSGRINVTHSCKSEEIVDGILITTAGKYEVAELNKNKVVLKTKM